MNSEAGGLQVPERGMILFDIQLYRENGSV